MADTVLHSRSGKEKKDNTSNSGVVSLIDAKIIEEHHIGGSKPCPRCGHKLTSKEDWPGLPAGVKFDPTDQELLEHLEAKVGLNGRKAHPLIDEFIPTLEGEEGICYTHPEKLPGVTKDGHSRHFFHRPSKAYTTGTRKRRKIQSECDLQGGETRWHKTGKTRPVLLNGKQKGCKKILVLYTNFGKQRKPEKTNWVMHQYHLGSQEDEKEGELVVSKVFYQTQPRQCSWERFPIATVDQALQHASSSSRLTIERADTGATATTIATTTTPSALHPLSGNSDRERFSSFSGLCQRSLDEGISESSSRCTPHSCEDGQQQDDDEQSQRSLVRTFPKCLEGNIAGKAAARATSLEDIFEIKEAGTSTFVNAQEVEWMNYSTHYWPNP